MHIGASRPDMLNPAMNPTSRGTTGARPLQTEEPVQSMPPTAASTVVDINDFMEAWGSGDTNFDIDGSGTVDGEDLGLFLAAQTAAASGESDLDALLGAWGTADPDWDLNGDGIVNGVDLGMHLDSVGDTDGETASAELTIEGFAEAWGGADPEYDLNSDGVVDGADLGVYLQQLEDGPDVDPTVIERFMGAWGTNDPEFDFNGDGIVDGTDLGQLLGGEDPIARQPGDNEGGFGRMAEKLAETVMSRFDADGDGRIPVSLLGVNGMGGERFDADGDGFVTRSEIAAVIQERLEGFQNNEGMVDQVGLRDYISGWQSRFGGGMMDDPIRDANQRWGFDRFETTPHAETAAIADRVEASLLKMGHEGIPSNINDLLDSIPMPGTSREAVLNSLLDRFPIGVEATG
ncbi:MAG: hypothetical protein CMJ34_06045 [Phycisphaerae bacterium]|nr:hypothetical protein [Phycisphaerae bacterium]